MNDPVRPATVRRQARLWLAVLLAGAAGPAAAENGVGAWSGLGRWPLIPIHTVLTRRPGDELRQQQRRRADRVFRLRRLGPDEGSAATA